MLCSDSWQKLTPEEQRHQLLNQHVLNHHGDTADDQYALGNLRGKRRSNECEMKTISATTSGRDNDDNDDDLGDESHGNSTEALTVMTQSMTLKGQRGSLVYNRPAELADVLNAHSHRVDDNKVQLECRVEGDGKHVGRNRGSTGSHQFVGADTLTNNAAANRRTTVQLNERSSESNIGGTTREDDGINYKGNNAIRRPFPVPVDNNSLNNYTQMPDSMAKVSETVQPTDSVIDPM